MRAPIGLRIRSQRKSLGLSQAELARRSSISASYLNLIEANKRDVGGTLLHRIAEALGLDISELTGDSEQRLIMSLEEALTEPVFVGSGLQPGDARELVAQHPQAAEALARVHRAYLEGQFEPRHLSTAPQGRPPVQPVAASGAQPCQRRPVLGRDRAGHRGPHRRRAQPLHRRHRARGARTSSDVAETLVTHFEQSSAQRRLATPQAGTQRLLHRRGHAFPDARIGGGHSQTRGRDTRTVQRGHPVGATRTAGSASRSGAAVWRRTARLAFPRNTGTSRTPA